jgi:hypothetical protein
MPNWSHQRRPPCAEAAALALAEPGSHPANSATAEVNTSAACWAFSLAPSSIQASKASTNPVTDPAKRCGITTSTRSCPASAEATSDRATSDASRAAAALACPERPWHSSAKAARTATFCSFARGRCAIAWVNRATLVSASSASNRS